MAEETYQQRLAAQLRKESEAFEADEQAKNQATIDRWAETERLAQQRQRQRRQRELDPFDWGHWGPLD